MSKLLEVGGSGVLFQLPRGPAEVTPVSRTGDVVEKLEATMAQLFDIVAKVADGFATAVADAPVETADLEFGLQITAAGRLYVVESKATAAIKVTLTVRPG